MRLHLIGPLGQHDMQAVLFLEERHHHGCPNVGGALKFS